MINVLVCFYCDKPFFWLSCHILYIRMNLILGVSILNSDLTLIFVACGKNEVWFTIGIVCRLEKRAPTKMVHP